MVPVGGSIVYSPQPPKSKKVGQEVGIVHKINNFYPGRASGAPIVDLFITMLQMGEQTFLDLLKQRKENFTYL
jgi:O-phospho-L-seryl-tRNASec:L-selenocysteinyl-tRNA synthase